MKKIVYEGYYSSTDVENIAKQWSENAIAKIPFLHKYKGDIGYWDDNKPAKKVRITIEVIG